MGSQKLRFPPVSYSEWRQRVESELGDADFSSVLTSKGSEGFSVEPLFTAEHPKKRQDPSDPSEVFLKNAEGVDSSRRAPEVCQLCDGEDVAEINRRLRKDLAGGTTGAWLRFGSRRGAISSLRDFRRAAEDLPIEPKLWMISLEEDPEVEPFLAVEALEERQREGNSFSVALRWDPLMETVGERGWKFDRGAAAKESAEPPTRSIVHTAPTSNSGLTTSATT